MEIKKKLMKFFNLENYSTLVKVLPIQKKVILLDCNHGKKIEGNIFYILKELTTNPKYQKYHVYLSVRDKYYAEIKKFYWKCPKKLSFGGLYFVF